MVLIHEELLPPETLEGRTEEEIAQWKMEYDVVATLQNLGHHVHPLGVANELLPIRNAITALRPHIAFNLLMHFHDAGVYDSAVVSYLELLKTPYTGCNARGLLLAGDKALSKKILSYHRIRVPRFATFPRGRRVRMPRRLSFPLFVKSVAEHASLGISQASIVHDEDALIERVEFIHRTVRTGAIAEEYVDGRELTIGVLGNSRLTTFPVWEVSFDNLPDRAPAIMTSKVKWDLAYQKKVGLKSGPATDLPAGTEGRITVMAKRIYRALGLSGFARIDMRMNAEGEVYVLEANPNPDLCFGEDFAESAERSGFGYLELLQRIVNLGLAYRAPWKG
ncbi:MAG: ATP-grasp domain-containing protein [bacterium]|nr:ATP-grasp domain-containing protein [bacterium]